MISENSSNHNFLIRLMYSEERHVMSQEVGDGSNTFPDTSLNADKLYGNGKRESEKLFPQDTIQY